MTITVVISVFLLFLTLIFFYYRHKYRFWSRLGVSGPTPMPVLGHVVEKFLQCPMECEWKWSQNYGEVYGIYYLTQPVLTINDPKLIKQVTIRDFNLFTNRRVLRAFNPYWNHNLFFAENDQWRRVRMITTPSFTTGKLRAMYPLMWRCVDKLSQYFDKLIGDANQNCTPIDLRKVLAGFTIDVIASTSFATETNANEECQKNVFVANGARLFQFPKLNLIGIICFPRWLNTLLGVHIPFANQPFEFFVQLSKQIIQQRKADRTRRNDLIQLLMDAYAYESDLKKTDWNKLDSSRSDEKGVDSESDNERTKPKKKLTEDEIVAQCIIFFLAGFETTASSLTYILFELSKNPEIQERLSQEVTRFLEDLEEEPNSDKYFDRIVNDIPYLDAVVKETLRLYPPIPRLERRLSAESYEIAGIKLRKDQLIEIAPAAVHYNPEYYPDPSCFNPDRFMPENKDQLVPYTYLPFGIGPRNCIGMRFAFQEIKMCLACLITKFRFRVNANTPNKLTFRTASPLLLVDSVSVDLEIR